MRLESNSLIDPILLFLLSQITVVLPMIIPFQKTASASGPTPPPVVRETARPPVATWPDLAGLRRELERAERLAQATATQMSQAEQEHQAALREAAQLADALRGEETRRQALETQVRQLEEEERRFREQAQQAAQAHLQRLREAAELERVLRDRRAVVTRLEEQLKAAGRPVGGDEDSGTVMTRTTKRAEWIELVNNRVVPVDEHHYSIERRSTVFGSVRIYTRRSQGETLEEAQRPGSNLMRFLRQYDPGKTFIACNVYKESFLIYRALRKFLRGMKYEVGWDPEEKDEGRLVLGACLGQGCTTVEPQH